MCTDDPDDMAPPPPINLTIKNPGQPDEVIQGWTPTGWKDYPFKKEFVNLVKKDLLPPKREDMTSPVGIDEEGRLWTLPGSNDPVPVNPMIAETTAYYVENDNVQLDLGYILLRLTGHPYMSMTGRMKASNGRMMIYSTVTTIDSSSRLTTFENDLNYYHGDDIWPVFSNINCQNNFSVDIRFITEVESEHKYVFYDVNITPLSGTYSRRVTVTKYNTDGTL